MRLVHSPALSTNTASVLWQALLTFTTALYVCVKLKCSPGCQFLLRQFSSPTKEDLWHVSLWQIWDAQTSHWQKAAASLLSISSDESAQFSA